MGKNKNGTVDVAMFNFLNMLGGAAMFDITPFGSDGNNMARIDDYFNRFAKNFFNNDFASLMDISRSPFKVDIRETDNAYLLEAELPDVKKEGINVEYNNNYLTISAKREDRTDKITDNFVRRERHFGQLKRSFYVDNVDENKIEASYHEGMLRVVLPKLENSKHGKKININ